jgi:hypothetical protein
MSIQTSQRGKLRLYLGAAPGVGKTYAMLAEAQRRRARGSDVVAALVVTHGRRLTAATAEGLEAVPPRTVTYRGTTFTEMDLDAVLARHPQVALVDELAHTNVPGCRNAKRWQDVDELLDAGIRAPGEPQRPGRAPAVGRLLTVFRGPPAASGAHPAKPGRATPRHARTILWPGFRLVPQPRSAPALPRQ